MWRRCHEMWWQHDGSLAIRMTRQNICFRCAKPCALSLHGHGIHGCEPTLIESDDMGLVCRPCFDRSWPPHLKYLHKLLGPSLNDDSNLTHIISEFAYPVCIQTFRGYCVKREPYWPGWACPVCLGVEPRTAGTVWLGQEATMRANDVGHSTNRGGWANTSGSDWQSGSGDWSSGSSDWQWGYWRR